MPRRLRGWLAVPACRACIGSTAPASSFAVFASGANNRNYFTKDAAPVFFRQPSPLYSRVPAQAGYGDKRAS